MGYVVQPNKVFSLDECIVLTPLFFLLLQISPSAMLTLDHNQIDVSILG